MQYFCEDAVFISEGGKEMQDEEIIALYFSRSEGAIDETRKKYGNYLNSIAMRILPNREDAEECVNDTYFSAWSTIPPKKPKHLSAFLGRIARNLSINRRNYLTTQKRGMGEVELALSELADCVASSANTEQAVEEKLLITAIETFLYEQPQQARRLFVLRYWHILSLQEAAKRCGMRQSKAASTLFRMRKKLRQYLEDRGIWL